MIRNLLSNSQNNTATVPTLSADIPPIYTMVNNFFSVLNTTIARLRDSFNDRDLTLTINEVIEGNITWRLQMQWEDVQGRYHEKFVNGLFEIPATTATRLFMEMQYYHYITRGDGATNRREQVECDEMWYHTITYVRMVEFIREVENWMMCVELDRC